MRFVPGKMRIALAAMVMCLGLSAMPGEAADVKSYGKSPDRISSNFGIFIGPGNGHHFNHYYDRHYGGFPFYRFNNAVGSTSIHGLPYVSRGYYNRYYRAHYKRRHFKRGHKQYKRTGYKSGKWCHYHTSKLPRTKKHSKVRCHKHRLHRHESIVHTR